MLPNTSKLSVANISNDKLVATLSGQVIDPFLQDQQQLTAEQMLDQLGPITWQNQDSATATGTLLWAR